MKTPKLKREWVGLIVRTNRDMHNGNLLIPEGTECMVSRNYNGLSLSSKPCPYCNVRVFIRGVLESSVTIVGRGEFRCPHCDTAFPPLTGKEEYFRCECCHKMNGLSSLLYEVKYDGE